MALLAAAGCHKTLRRQISNSGADSAALSAAAQREHEFVAAYDAAIAKAGSADLPALQVARALHATHLAALHDAGAVSTTSTTTAVRSLSRALTRSAADLRRLAVSAESGSNAALLASIAGSHQVSASG